MAMQIYSKVERALGSIHILLVLLLFLRVPPIFSLRLALPAQDARGFAGRSDRHEKRPIMRQKIRQLGRFVPADR